MTPGVYPSFLVPAGVTGHSVVSVKKHELILKLMLSRFKQMKIKLIVMFYKLNFVTLYFLRLNFIYR